MFVAVFPLLGALLGGLQFVDTVVRATSAPQEAAGMATACAWAVIPYVFARSIEMLRSSSTPRPIQPPPAPPTPTP